MEFIIGGLAAVGAGCFTNPLEVVKTRLQLQGELRARGQYAVHYRNFFHAFYIIAKTDGILALQKGLVPALWHQVLLNGTRLGVYQFAEERKWHLKPNGEVSLCNTLIISATAGFLGAYTGSPLYLVCSCILVIFVFQLVRVRSPSFSNPFYNLRCKWHGM